MNLIGQVRRKSPQNFNYQMRLVVNLFVKGYKIHNLKAFYLPPLFFRKIKVLDIIAFPTNSFYCNGRQTISYKTNWLMILNNRITINSFSYGLYDSDQILFLV